MTFPIGTRVGRPSDSGYHAVVCAPGWVARRQRQSDGSDLQPVVEPLPEDAVAGGIVVHHDVPKAVRDHLASLSLQGALVEGFVYVSLIRHGWLDVQVRLREQQVAFEISLPLSREFKHGNLQHRILRAFKEILSAQADSGFQVDDAPGSES